ncbi:MAG: hypothetical protein J0M11_12495 [Anaerolineae bacterium]|nr:hypothetical protein [Anaerolineae bacterium]
MTTQKPERKDWMLLIFIIPIAALLLLFVGQWAIRLLPFWSVNAGMNSNLEPEDSSAAHPFALLEPLLPQILIPLPWADTYLDPGEDFSFPPFLTFEPTASPSPTANTPAPTEATPTATIAPTETPTATSIVGTSPTNEGGGEETPTETATPPTPATCTDPLANNQGQPLPCTYLPATCTDPLANNQGQPLPCTYPPAICTDPLANNQGQPLPCTYPPATCTDPLANNQGQPLPCTFDPICPGAHNPDGPLPCDYGNVSTPPVGVTQVTPDPEIDVNAPPDDGIGSIDDGSFIVLNLSVTVSSIPDNFYDLVLYEWNNGGSVFLDLIIIGITNDETGGTYYEVFNWGDNVADTNSNVSDQAAGGEEPDEEIEVSDATAVPPTPDTLHDPDYEESNGTNGPLPQTGILIDVDNAASNPPPNTYEFVVIISPSTLPGDTSGNAQVDAIMATEVPIPTP